MKKLFLTGAVLLALSAVALAAPESTRPTIDMAGRDLNRTKDYLEHERVAREIEEQRETRAAGIEQERREEGERAHGELSFVLKSVKCGPSAVLTDAELAGASEEFINSEVRAADLYTIVERINALYAAKGYVTCRADLAPQKIQEGAVEIALFEGRSGHKEVTGNKYTRDSYVLNRIHLPAGEVPNVNEMDKDLLRFNAANDAQLRIVMKEGTEPGTTDYELRLYEPKNTQTTIFFDRAGSYTTGELREGIFYNYRSLTGRRDSLLLGYVHSEGTDAVSLGYSFPIGRAGTKMSLSYSTNDVESVKHTELSRTEGDSDAVSIGVTHPLRVTRHSREDISLDYTHQSSKSDFLIGGYRLNIVDDSIDEWALGYSLTHYTRSSVLYQKLSYIFGNADSTPAFFGSRRERDYNALRYTGLYQKLYRHGQQLTGRVELQHTEDDDIPSARAFYLGGTYSVRGYKENFLGSAGGMSASIEYQVPLRADRRLNAFTFFDYGRLWGQSAQSTDLYRDLSSLGLGLKADIGKNYYLTAAVGFPLKKDFDLLADDAGSARFHFMASGQF